MATIVATMNFKKTPEDNKKHSRHKYIIQPELNPKPTVQLEPMNECFYGASYRKLSVSPELPPVTQSRATSATLCLHHTPTLCLNTSIVTLAILSTYVYSSYICLSVMASIKCNAVYCE